MQSAAEGSQSAVEFSVFSLNCWGLRFISKNRRERFRAVAAYLHQAKYTFVAFQEVWSHGDFKFLQETLREVLPYSHYFESGIIGSGLCIFSQRPIRNCFFVPFSANGYFYKLWHGDWFSGKGIGICQTSLNDDVKVNILTAHTHVETQGPEYRAHRLSQALCLVDAVNLCAESADVTILAADLNSTPDGLLTRLVVEAAGLHDAFFLAETVSTHPSLLRTSSGDHYADIGGTCGLPSNSYSAKKHFKCYPSGWRLDYILCRATPTASGALRVLNYTRPLPSRVTFAPTMERRIGQLKSVKAVTTVEYTEPQQKYSYSDHEAIAARFVYTHSGISQAGERFPPSCSARASQKGDGKGSSLSSGSFCDASADDIALSCTTTASSRPYAGKRGGTTLFEEATRVLETSLNVLRLRKRFCCAFGVCLFLALFASVYHPSLSPGTMAWLSVLRMLMAILAFILAVVQPIMISQEINTLRGAQRSLTRKIL